MPRVGKGRRPGEPHSVPQRQTVGNVSASESARCRPALIDAPASFLLGFPLPEASTAEDALHAVVGLVAGVLEQETVDDS